MTEIELKIEKIAAPEPYDVYVLPVSAFPADPQDETLLRRFLDVFCATAMRLFRLSPEVFLQLEQLRGKECRAILAGNGKKWMPQMGLGVWVDRPAPEKWTQQELDDIVPGGKLRPLMFNVFRISAPLPVRAAARRQMLKYGSVVEVLTPLGDGYLPKIAPAIRAGIVDPTYNCFPFYVPLIEAKNMLRESTDELDRWFDGVGVYVRESFEDNGVLIAAPGSLQRVFEDLGGHVEHGGWVFPDRYLHDQ